MNAPLPTAAMLTVGVWSAPGFALPDHPLFMVDDETATPLCTGAHVVMERGALARIETLLAAGASRVLLGEKALLDTTMVQDAIARFGTQRIGLWLPARRMAVSWSLDRESNADFSFVMPTCPVPRWELLLADGTGTGTDAAWFAREMARQGVEQLVISLHQATADDLGLCAELSEELGDRLWLTFAEGGSDPAPWIAHGGVRQLIVNADACNAVELERLAAAVPPAAPTTTQNG
ncbi:HisA/HisF-related TIM barrel protein [Sulfurivermis fontis]|jgi:imidazole glycerol phosphate synthase subunit HisF|uniref:HisA/HisF-related TIM barrel protein n=1 Tax=Sulfurivermis fontis TaxID=1972068 RepID=UPI000FDAAF4D|nr:HisA/HisF-related TIM barrel protein [Sulfurivermis fontis]